MKHSGFPLEFVSHKSALVVFQFEDFVADEDIEVPLPQKGQTILLRARPYERFDRDAKIYDKHLFKVDDVIIDYYGKEITVVVSYMEAI